MDTAWLYAPEHQLTLVSSATIAAPGTRSAQTPPETLRLLFVRRGNCHVLQAGSQEALAGDRMVLLHGGVRYRVEAPSDDLTLSQVDISHMPYTPHGYSLRQLYQNYPDYQRLCHDTRPLCAFHDRFALLRFSAESLDRYALYEPAQRGMMTGLALSYMLLATASAIYEGQRRGRQYNRHVRRAVEYIHENYMCNLTAEDIASYVGIHSGHLHRLFRTEMGTRVTEYLTNVRLQKAKDLLRRTDLPIASVTFLCGVSSQQYLSRLFRQHVGVTPQAYRRSYNVTCAYDAIGEKYQTVSFSDSAGEAL